MNKLLTAIATVAFVVFVWLVVTIEPISSQPPASQTDQKSVTAESQPSNSGPIDSTGGEPNQTPNQTPNQIEEDQLRLTHELCLYGCPAGKYQRHDVVMRPIYLLKMNPDTKFADWVAYRVSRQTIGKSHKRTWREDPAIKPEIRMRPVDYKGAYRSLQTDRGHQVPLASFSATEYWHTTNYLSNITPQKSHLNRGPWKRLEARVRKLAKQPDIDYVFVMSGPLYQREMPSLPNFSKPHKVPSGYWKIVALRYRDKLMTASFVMDQDSGQDDNFCRKASTIRNIEQYTHLNFFHGLSQQEQDRFETSAGNLFTLLGCTVTASS